MTAQPHPAESQIAELVKSDKVVLFMKGNKHFPQCGFSAKVIGMLSELLPSFKTVNVLSDPAIREGVKAFSKWPTIPQLYVDGEFVGGCDIVTEMYESGELQTLLGVKDTAEVKVPTITLSASAAKAFKDAAESPDDHPRLQISAQFAYELFLDQKQAGDVEVAAGGLTILLDKASAKRADGTTIDFVSGPGSSGGFKIENPNEPPRVKSLTAKDLKAMLDRGDKLELFDVRTPAERAQAKIEGAIHLDEAAQERLLALDKKTPLVFHCHHGMRSRSAAEHFLKQGFTKVFNLEGGIDSWSQTVDPSVPKY
jgi:monothiol glutaredoxin